MILRRNLTDFFKEFSLAKIAAVLWILTESFNVQLFGFADDLMDAIFLAKGFGFIQFPLWKGTGDSRYGENLVAQNIVSCAQ